MKIELKNIKTYEKLSEETIAFTAYLYIDGYRIADCKNDGHGGSTNIRVNYNDLRAKDLYQKAEQYCSALSPDTEYGIEIPIDLEFLVDSEVDKFLIEKDKTKFEKKLQRDMLKGICYGSKEEYRVCSWKKMTIDKLLRFPKGIEAIKDKINELREKGENILNTNLGELL